jgi:hypothetical protein
MGRTKGSKNKKTKKIINNYRIAARITKFQFDFLLKIANETNTSISDVIRWIIENTYKNIENLQKRKK